jgi:tripeptide aminopeptidase
MEAYERLLKYVRVDTQSDEDGSQTPSTACQHELAKLLEREMVSLGLENVRRTENAYVYGCLPASPECQAQPTVGLIAHIDTAPDFSGSNVQPRIISGYDGGDIALGNGRVLSPKQFPDLTEQQGKDLIVTDGSTLLGADDKAGVAEILTACEKLLHGSKPHCAVAVCFCPDEEIGHGAELLDIPAFGADFAYTVDGDDVNELNYETFNAAAATWTIKGVNVHPGSAKDVMVNASLVAMEINSLLPPEEIPGKTENYQGFFHLTDMCGNCERAELKYIIRDHDEERFLTRQRLMEQIQRELNQRYGQGTVSLTIIQQYKNMAYVLKDKMEIVDRAAKAMEKAGLAPSVRSVRGGTDGSQLSYRGLPCPNLGTGGHGFHGPYEHISVQDMDKVVEILINLVSIE